MAFAGFGVGAGRGAGGSCGVGAGDGLTFTLSAGVVSIPFEAAAGVGAVVCED